MATEEKGGMAPLFPCPECGGNAINIATGYDPFAQRSDSIFGPVAQNAIELKCAKGHEWIESQRYDHKGRAVGPREYRPFQRTP
jgi:hypothetical protein